jgi:hypothetical protein
LERKNGWMSAERAGELCPDGMQRLLNQTDWDADAVRDEVRAFVLSCFRAFVLEHLAPRTGVLAVDETVRHEAAHVLHWSRWRRRHQHRACLSHCRRRGHRPP